MFGLGWFHDVMIFYHAQCMQKLYQSTLIAFTEFLVALSVVSLSRPWLMIGHICYVTHLSQQIWVRLRAALFYFIG